MANLPQLKKPQVIGISAGVAVVIAAFFIWGYRPLVKKTGDLTGDLKKKKTELADVLVQERRIVALQVDIRNVEVEVKEAERKLPKGKEIPSLLRSVSKLASQYHLNVSNFTPQSVKEASTYVEVPFMMNLACQYHQLGLFLTEVAQLERIMNVRGLQISGKAPSQDDPSNISASFQLVTYTFKEGS